MVKLLLLNILLNQTLFQNGLTNNSGEMVLKIIKNFRKGFFSGIYIDILY